MIQNIILRATDEVTVYYKGSYIIWGNTGGYVDKQDNFIGKRLMALLLKRILALIFQELRT